MTTAVLAATPAARIQAQPFLVRRAAVLGAGTMGSRIAAHLANAGIPTLLLDMVPAGEGDRSRLAKGALEALGKAKPAAFYDAALAGLVTPGNFEDDLGKLAGCDWVIEAVAENLEIKTALLGRVVGHLGPQAVLTTNTSGLPVKQIAAGLAGHRARFFGTHFFNPPRYMKLLEIIPTAETDAGVLAAFAAFADRNLGKQVVFANDTPNFIANRIGVAVMFNAATLMLEQGLTVEEVDALTGSAIGWPRTGTFRLADMVGIDILAHVAANFPQGVTQGSFGAVLDEIVKRGWLGDKAGQGFYKKSKGADGKDLRLVLDVATFEYRPAAKTALPGLEMAKNATTLPERLKLLLANDPAKDKAAKFLWPFLASLWNFAAERIGEVAGDGVAIDRAMKAGFNWELGPFEMWDAAGVRETVARMKALGLPVSGWVEALLDSGPGVSWYSPDGPQCYNPTTGGWEAIPEQPGHARVADFRRANGVLRSNAGASLVDLGDGIGCIELHSLKNAIGGNVLANDLFRAEAGFGCGEELCRVCDCERPGELQRGREPDATPAGGAGGRVGRCGRGDTRLPADDGGDQVLPAAGGGRTVWADAWRRRGDLPACGTAAAPRGNLHWAGRGGSGTDSRRRGNKGDAAASAGPGCGACTAGPEGSTIAVCPVGGGGCGGEAGV